jgi:hypothetical protein
MYLGLKLLGRLDTLRGWQLRRIVGHLVSYFGVIRPALACFRACYDFYSQNLEDPRPIPAAVRSELHGCGARFGLSRRRGLGS